MGGTRDARFELTPRQREVLDLLALGHTNTEIAGKLGISVDGVKWHVREILGRLQVESRDEAADLWLAYKRPSARLARGAQAMLAPVTLRWAVGGAGICAATATGVLVLFALRSDGPGADGSPSATTPTPPTAQVSTTPIAPAEVLATGQPVPFNVCSTAAWKRPTLDEIAPDWNAPRFQDPQTGRLFTGNFIYYLSSFNYIEDPVANSALIEPSTFSGIKYRVPPRPDPCDVRNFQRLWLAEYRALEFRRAGEHLVVRVAPSPGTFDVVGFEAVAPALRTGPKPGPVSYTSVSLVDSGGRLLSEILGDASSRWQVDAGGGLVFAWFDIPDWQPVPGPAPFGSRGDSTGLKVVAGWAGTAGDVVVADTSGREVLRASVGPAAAGWDELATITVPPGSHTLRFEPGQGERPAVLIVPATQPLP